MTTLESQPYCKATLKAIDAMLERNAEKQPAVLRRINLDRSQVAQVKAYPISKSMSEADLVALKKNAKRAEKHFLLRVTGEKYPEKRMPIEALKYLEGVNGEVVFVR